MLTKAWQTLRYHSHQDKLWRTPARFVAVAAGRGSGKTELARRRIVRFLPIGKLYFYALPTYRQAKRIAWKPILSLIPKHWITRIHETDMRIETIFGSVLYIIGMDKPQRIEGDQWDGGVIDESCDQKPGTFALSVLPALSHKNGWYWRIGVPKRVGVGATEFKTFCFHEAEEYYTWASSTVLTTKQLEYARKTLDPKDFNEQYNATWETAGGAVFYAFNEVLNVSADVAYDPDAPLIIGSDFNVSPMAWVVCQKYNKTLLVLDELFERDTNTQATLDLLYNKYHSHTAGWEFYGDATSRSRNTRTSMSDYLHIRNDQRFTNSRVLYPASNPAVANRFSACNSAFCNAAGERRVLIHPRCKNLIRDLNSRHYKPNSNAPHDVDDLGHISDALGYVLYKLFPLMVSTFGSSPVYVTR